MKESRPSRGKRILAVAGIVLLAGMYVATLVCALLDVEITGIFWALQYTLQLWFLFSSGRICLFTGW